jgi:hypothetical protein
MIQLSRWIDIQEKRNVRDTCTYIFIAAFFTTAKIWEQTKCGDTCL